MKICAWTVRASVLGIVFVVAVAALQAAPLPIQVMANAWQAAAGNSASAFILVHLANPDGTPKIDAQIPVVDPRNPTAGLQLKGTRWAFQTMVVPPGFQGPGVQQLQPQTLLSPPTSRVVEMEGQLRLMQIQPQFRLGAPNDPQAGLYAFAVLPEYGFAGGNKALLRWVAGEYHFRVRYQDGPNQGTAFGTLTIH